MEKSQPSMALFDWKICNNIHSSESTKNAHPLISSQ